MKWTDVRKKYPNKWLFLRSLNKVTQNDTLFIDEVEVILIIDNNKDIINFLKKSNSDNFIYHTSKEIIEIEIRKRIGFRIKSKNGGGCNE